MADKFDLELDASEFLKMLNGLYPKVNNAAKQATEDMVDQIIRIASDIAPIDKGILQKSHTKKVSVGLGGVNAEIKFSVMEGNYDYALRMHEGIYNHGEQTMKRGGTTGRSGKFYYAGRKYLERPMKGEEQEFFKYVAKAVKKATGAE